MRVGVFFGSRTPEHDVSIITGQLIISGLKELGHEVVPVYIGKTGIWHAGEELGSLEFFKQPDIDSKLKKFEGFNLDMSQLNKVVLKKQTIFNPKVYEIDLAFPTFQGQNGEDGTIQGIFELLNVPYVGCDVTSSAITMDKVLTKLIYERFNIPTTNFIHFFVRDWKKRKNEIVNEITSNLTYPLFVKPARLGSSIGIARVDNDKDLEFAIEVALHYDTKVLVEEGVKDLMDITVAVMGNDDLTTSLIQESAYTEGFFSYEDKYIKEGGAQLGNAEKKIIIPARLDEKTTKDIQEVAKEIYKLIGCSGIARVDFLYDKTFKKYYANEVNTLPGTLYHHLWKESGISLTELLSKLLELAEEKHMQKQKLNYTFESEILKKANSQKLALKGN